MLDPAGVDAVLLDAGGVLLLPSPDGMRRALAPFAAAPDDETCFRAHYSSTNALDDLDVVDWRAVDRMLARALGVAEEHLDAAADAIGGVYLSEAWVPVPGAAEALRALQAAGYGLAVVSNALGTMEEQLAAHEICSVIGGTAAEVSIVVDSAVVGVDKPDPRIFGFALDALGAPPERCIYVGDTTYFDVAGAEAAGLLPVHLDPFGDCRHRGHVHQRSLDELVGSLVPV
jgi:putative hydrolase of the HAD superfamily